ncbi:hypothetical protein BDZ91DRAFT_539591 [Kalaharituber pfeilii]|nr:hypothetical protein BDZ91DRAFT_539591 [Kalaharituber pfeilii]
MTMGPPSVSEVKALLLNGGINNQANAGKGRSSSPAKDVFGSPPPLLPPLRPMKALESSHGSSSHTFSSNDLESLSNQLVGLTNIATNLQKEMATLSRRSKDNATDLVSLKEATIARDEDIRHSLRELVQSIGMLEMSSPTPAPLLLRAPSPSVGSSGGSSTFDGDFGGGVGGGSGGGGGGNRGGPSSSGSGRPFGDRHFGQSAGALINKLNQASGSTPRSIPSDFGKMGMEMQILERILRDMSTKDGENRIMDSLFELKKSVGTKQGEKEMIGLIEAVRDDVQAISEDIVKRMGNAIVPMDVAKPGAANEFTNGDDILRVLERVVKEVMIGKGISDETKASVLQLNDEVQSGRLATEELKTELMAVKVELVGGKSASEEFNGLMMDLKQEVQENRGTTDETKELVHEVKAGVLDGKIVMEEIMSHVTNLKERMDSSRMVMDETKDGVADLKGDVRGSRTMIEEVKQLVAGLKENIGKESNDTLKLVLEGVEKLNAGQTQLQLRPADTASSDSKEAAAFNAAAITAINATLSRTIGSIEALQNRLEEFSEEAGEASGYTKAQLASLMKFIDEITQNTTANTHESREVRKLFEVIRMGVQSMNDRLAAFEGEVITRLDDGVQTTSITKNFEGEETIRERRQMWREIREDIEEVRRELNDISTDLERKRKLDEETVQMRNHVDDSILEILKHQKRGGEILMAQGQLHAMIRDKVDEVKSIIEEQVLRGILAAQKAGTDMLVTHRMNGEELKGEVLSLRSLIEEQIISQILHVSRSGGDDLSNDILSIKQNLQGIISKIMDKSEAQALGDQVNSSITEVKQIVQGLVGKIMEGQNDGREGVQSKMEEIKKLLDEVIGQVLEKQKGFGMGVLEVIKEVKKIVTEKFNSKSEEELLMKMDEIKRLSEKATSPENRDAVLNAVAVLRGIIENSIATREGQEDIMNAVSTIRRIVEDKAMEGNYLGAMADLREFIEEKDFLRQRQDNSINGMLINAVAEVKRAMLDKEVGEDLMAAASEIKSLLEEKQIVRAQQIAREDELKHQIGLIQRILEEGVIRAIVHLQRDLGDGIRGDMAEVKEQGHDVRSDVSEMKRIVEDDVKTKILDMKIMLEDELRADVGAVKKAVEEDIKSDILEVKKSLGKINLADIESHKKSQAGVKEVLEAVGDLQTDLKGQQSKHFSNFQELKFLIQQHAQSTAKSSEPESQPPQVIQYDDASLQEKLDKVLAHNTTSVKAFNHLEMLPEIYTKIVDTAAQVSDFITVQKSLMQESSTKQVEAAGQAILALEKARAERAIIEAATAQLKELEASLTQTTKALKEDVEALQAKKLALSSDLASINTTLVERRAELDRLSEEADTIQRRVVEGALEQARQLVEMKSQRKSATQSLKRVNSTRNKSSTQQQPPPAASNSSPRRYLSMGQLSTSQTSSETPSKGRSIGGSELGKDYYSVTGGFSNRKEDLRSPEVGTSGKIAEGRENDGSGIGAARLENAKEGMRSSDALTLSGVMVEDWDDKLHGEEMGLAGPDDDWGVDYGKGPRKGSKTYPRSLSADSPTMTGHPRAASSGTFIDKRDISSASMGSIDE